MPWLPNRLWHGHLAVVEMVLVLAVAAAVQVAALAAAVLAALVPVVGVHPARVLVLLAARVLLADGDLLARVLALIIRVIPVEAVGAAAAKALEVAFLVDRLKTRASLVVGRQVTVPRKILLLILLVPPIL